MKLKNIVFICTYLILTSSLLAQRFEKGNKLISFGIGSGGEKPNEIWVSNPVNGNNMIQDGTKTYDLKRSPLALSFNGQYFLSSLISIGAYLSPTSSSADVSGNYKNFSYFQNDYDKDGQPDDRYTRKHTETRTLRSYYYGAKCEVHLAHKLKLDNKWDTYTGLSIGSVIKRERVYNRQDVDYYEYNVNSPNYYSSSTLIPNSNDQNYTWSPNSGNGANFFIGARYFFKDNLGVGLELGIPNKYAHLSLAFQF